MTSPLNFGVSYDINPWMTGNKGSVDVVKACQQWAELRNTLVGFGADVIVLPRSPEYCPDAVFTANAGLIFNNTFIPSRFRHEERMGEEPFFINWFLENNFNVELELPEGTRLQTSFEGAGDALFNLSRTILWYGTGFRSTLGFKATLDRVFENTNVIVRPLELVDPRFYHLDTCFCPTGRGDVLWYPPAFSDYSQSVIELWYKEKAIAVDEVDAINFACNAVSVGDQLATPIITPFLAFKLKNRGYRVEQHNMSEFKKSGGATKCLTLEVVS